MKIEITPDSFAEVVKAMLPTDEGALVQAVGEALRDRKEVTVKACGDILARRQTDSTAAIPRKAPATVVSWVKAVA